MHVPLAQPILGSGEVPSVCSIMFLKSGTVASDCRVGDSAYFEQLTAYCYDPVTRAHWRKYLLTLPIGGFCPDLHIPVTHHKAQLMAEQVPLGPKYLMCLVQQDGQLYERELDNFD